MHRLFIISILSAGAVLGTAAESDRALEEQAAAALERAVKFFRSQVSVQGTYLWQYSEDLSQRHGESKATETQGWVQPPGTPSVGQAFLSAWRATSNAVYLEAARETARGLIRGQLHSGGWHYAIDFSPEARRKTAYRDGGNRAGRNVTTLDDNTTQAALRFLIQLDAALDFQDPTLREPIQYALRSLVKAQYPNGAWPQGYSEFPDPIEYPVKKANYPETWERRWPGSGQYWRRYTLNDNAQARTIELMLDAARTYDDVPELAAQCRAAAEEGGDFLLLAQMPEPQPAWAQQYDFEMRPAWARKFEPPAVTGGESQGALRTLLRLYRETGRAKYLEPVPGALDYLRRSRLSDGRLARFYELRSNRPLYFTRKYELTYDHNDLPTHYGFKVADETDSIRRAYEQLKNKAANETQELSQGAPVATDKLLAEVQQIVAAQDARGAWVEPGRLSSAQQQEGPSRVIRTARFIRNVEILSRYLAARPAGLQQETGGVEPGWISLFDGRTLNGWVQRGSQAQYRVEDGQIVGRSVPNTPNSFLCTQQDFADFVLELEFKVDQGLNSGVQIRSHAFDEPTEFQWQGKTIRVPARRVHGLQVEIDPSARAWTGGLYEEGARGWLHDLKNNESARQAFKAGQWNRFRIECRGSSVKTWINGVPGATLTDDRVASGFIGLQVHGVGKNEKILEVRFRQLRLKVL